MYDSRGEIAVRVLSSARELGLHTITLSTADDDAHTSYAHETVRLPFASSYTDVDYLVSLCRKNRVDLVHPGYGFLSESLEFCKKLEAVGVTFVGPSPEILRRTGDKLSARRLAQQCGVPVLPALSEPVDTVQDLQDFAQNVGFPIMIKAVDGGGGRGIRLVNDAAALQQSFARAVNESPSRKVFAEKAAVGGFRHVEVQVLGDGRGNVRHFWDRECSIQRRFQKIVEVAPAAFLSASLRTPIIGAALRMAKTIKYLSLGTWEFLVSSEGSKFYFMEVNPRLQVEHTVTEAICGTDLVRFQLLLALSRRNQTDEKLTQALPLAGAAIASDPPPSCCALQLRITAEDPQQNFSLSIGRIRQVVWPGGNGVRVDGFLRTGTVVASDFDSLLAKVIVTGADWTAIVQKAERALQDTVVDGVVTNLALLQNIVRSKDFQQYSFDTQWLESNLGHILTSDRGLLRRANTESFKSSSPTQTPSMNSRSTDDLLRKGDRFNFHLEGKDVSTQLENVAVSVTGVIRNDFPHALALRLSSADGLSRSQNANGEDYILRVSKQTESQRQSGSNGLGEKAKDRKADVSHVLRCPIAGQLVEVLVDDGDPVSEGDAVIIVRQMKMELEVRAHRSGIVSSLFAQDEGDDIAVGTIICSILTTGGRGKL